MFKFNPWWQTGIVPATLKGRPRKALGKVKRLLSPRQVVLITGLRRVGKTTLMYQLIDELLKEGVPPYHILYFTFDEPGASLKEILSRYETEVLKKSFYEVERCYLFFDEIQKAPDWVEELKISYDLYPGLKFVISGSAAILERKGLRESLAGRFLEYVLKPLDPIEFLEFADIRIDSEREELYESVLRRAIAKYCFTGGFIEALSLPEDLLPKYFKESLLERIVYRDLPQEFGLTSPDLLYALLLLLAERPGMLLNFHALSQELRRDRRTLENYFFYLRYALCCQILWRYEKTLATSYKKLKKAYLSNPAFTLALNPSIDQSLLLEQFFVNWFSAKFFYRNKTEIDLVRTNGHVLPIEIKIAERVKKTYLRSMFNFLEKNAACFGLIITDKEDTEFRRGDFLVRLLPYWKVFSLLQLTKARFGE